MQRFTILGLALTGFMAGYVTPATAQVAEIRAGLAEFDERSINVGGDSVFADENSVAVTGEVIFEKPDFFKWKIAPRPYVNGSLNLGGKTSYAGAGLVWRQNFGKKLYGDFGFGLVAHDGTIEIDRVKTLTDASISEYFRRLRSEKEFGSRILFRQQFTLGYRVDEKWAGEVYFEHLSHGKIITDKINDGADIIGVRAARRF